MTQTGFSSGKLIPRKSGDLNRQDARFAKEEEDKTDFLTEFRDFSLNTTVDSTLVPTLGTLTK